MNVNFFDSYGTCFNLVKVLFQPWPSNSHNPLFRWQEFTDLLFHGMEVTTLVHKKFEKNICQKGSPIIK